MTYTYKNASESATISLSEWNSLINQTTFSQFLSSPTGVLNPYVVANKTTVLSNITSFATRYIGDKDIRSNYMTITVNASVTPNTWTTLSSTNGTVTTFNQYHNPLTGESGFPQYARIDSTLFNTTNFTIQTNTNSLYLIYANLKYANPSNNVLNVNLRITNNGNYYGNTVASNYSDKETNSVNTGTTTYNQIQYFTGCYNTAYQSKTYGIQLNASAITVNPIIEFGYVELISLGSTCGKARDTGYPIW